MKKTICLLLAILFLSTMITPVSADSYVRLKINGTTQNIGQRLIDGVTYVPIRAFSNAVANCSIRWDGSSSTAIVRYANLNINAGDYAYYIECNGRYFSSGAPNKLIGGTMYVPLRPLASAFGASVGWVSSTTTAVVTTGSFYVKSGNSYYNQDDLYWLSRIISAESLGQPIMGQIAVGSVIMNRVDSNEYPNDIYSVIFDTRFGTQFTPVATGTIWNNPDEQSVIAAKITLEGYRVNSNIMYFMNESKATSAWIRNNCDYAFTIGEHSFWV